MVYQSVEEVKRELASKGISMDIMIKLCAPAAPLAATAFEAGTMPCRRLPVARGALSPAGSRQSPGPPGGTDQPRAEHRRAAEFNQCGAS